jgi:hypothetical protein
MTFTPFRGVLYTLYPDENHHFFIHLRDESPPWDGGNSSAF